MGSCVPLPKSRFMIRSGIIIIANFELITEQLTAA
jgi:hypothetical protein